LSCFWTTDSVSDLESIIGDMVRHQQLVKDEVDDHYVDRRKIDFLLDSLPWKPEEKDVKWRQNKWIIRTPSGLSREQINELKA